VERGGVPVGEQDLAHDLLDLLVADPPVLPRRAAGQHQPAQGVGAVVLHQLERVEHVAQVLAHLAAVLVQEQPEAQHRLVGRPVEHHRPDGHQRVEPAAGLVDRLADELRRVGRLDAGVRVADLRERHRARVVPDVDHLGHPPALGAALLARHDDVVDERPVRVERGQVLPGARAEVGQALHDQPVAGSAVQRQTGSGVPQ
jgi:hypothetical protein